MFQDTLTKLADIAAAKAKASAENPVGFFLASALAGVYVGFGILLIFSLGSLLDPSVRPLAMGACFGLALILVVFAGSELFTGLTMSMAVGVAERRVGLSDLGRVWLISWFGNLAGALFLALLFITAGGGVITTAASELIYKAAAAKMDADAVELVARAILCNWLVCLALWMSQRIASETARMIAISWCLFAFVASGYEHSVANMTVFGVALMSDHPQGLTLAGAGWNLIWVTLGNTIGGALMMGMIPWLASRRRLLPSFGRRPAEVAAASIPGE